MSDGQRPCPNCGQVEMHRPITAEYAENNTMMTVMCTVCGEQFAKYAEVNDAE